MARAQSRHPAQRVWPADVAGLEPQKIARAYAKDRSQHLQSMTEMTIGNSELREL